MICMWSSSLLATCFRHLFAKPNVPSIWVSPASFEADCHENQSAYQRLDSLHEKLSLVLVPPQNLQESHLKMLTFFIC